MQSQNDLPVKRELTEFERRLFLAKCGRIKTKYRKNLYKKLISDGFFTEKCEFTQAGYDALYDILHPSDISESVAKAFREMFK